jgi:hypothetical protein
MSLTGSVTVNITAPTPAATELGGDTEQLNFRKSMISGVGTGRTVGSSSRRLQGSYTN